jgi:hypothetical protein
MPSRFMPATRKRVRARIALAGPSGAGKTLTGLKLLYTLVGAETVADGRGLIAVVDTERDSADRYAANPELPGVNDMTPDLAGGYGFSKISPVRFDPRDLVNLIDEAAEAGFGGLMVDSLSHYWFGPGGMLELVDLFARNHGGRSLDGWREARPLERAYIEALLNFPGHVVACMRSKQRYEVGDDHAGQKKVIKLGLQPDQRDGLEYEFDVVGDLDAEHYLRVTKTRYDALDGQIIHKPGAEFAQDLLTWLEFGEKPSAVDWDAAINGCRTRDDLEALWQRAQRAGQGRLRAKFQARNADIAAAQAAQAVEPDRDPPADGAPPTGQPHDTSQQPPTGRDAPPQRAQPNRREPAASRGRTGGRGPAEVTR